jgi:acylphosphatase
MGIKRVHLLITGQVQGVGFRYHTQQEAEALHLTGWVRNLADSRVEIIAQGQAHQLAQFIQWCHSGPSQAVVQSVEVHALEIDDPLDEFDIYPTAQSPR